MCGGKKLKSDLGRHQEEKELKYCLLAFISEPTAFLSAVVKTQKLE
jgi:hypothetical protein